MCVTHTELDQCTKPVEQGNALRSTATHCNTLQNTAEQCSTLQQHAAIPCNILQHPAPTHQAFNQASSTSCKDLKAKRSQRWSQAQASPGAIISVVSAKKIYLLPKARVSVDKQKCHCPSSVFHAQTSVKNAGLNVSCSNKV